MFQMEIQCRTKCCFNDNLRKMTMSTLNKAKISLSNQLNELRYSKTGIVFVSAEHEIITWYLVDVKQPRTGNVSIKNSSAKVLVKKHNP